MTMSSTQDWRHARTTDLGLRAAGVAILGVAALALRTLSQLCGPASHTTPGAMACLLAAVGFVCASLGGALLLLGHHGFDEVEVSERWRLRN